MYKQILSHHQKHRNKISKFKQDVTDFKCFSDFMVMKQKWIFGRLHCIIYGGKNAEEHVLPIRLDAFSHKWSYMKD